MEVDEAGVGLPVGNGSAYPVVVQWFFLTQEIELISCELQRHLPEKCPIARDRGVIRILPSTDPLLSVLTILQALRGYRAWPTIPVTADDHESWSSLPARLAICWR